MENKIIETIYYIPDYIKNGGNFYHEYAGFDSFLPDNIQPLLENVPDFITLDTLPDYLQEKYNIRIKRTGGAIVKNGVAIKPYVAYRTSQLNFVNKQELIKNSLETIKRYYKFIYEEEKNNYIKEKEYINK